MPAMTIPTSLGLCGECIDNPEVDGGCECAVDMRICATCKRGPLNDDEDDCGECRTYECWGCGEAFSFTRLTDIDWNGQPCPNRCGNVLSPVQ